MSKRIPPPPLPDEEEEEETGPEEVAEPVLAEIPKGRRFPCFQCGASLEYKPGSLALHCGHCGHEEKIPQSAADVRELCFTEHLARGNVDQAILDGAVSEVNCPGCGAAVEVPANIATDSCPFCATHLEARHAHSPKPMIKPNGVLPFKVEEREAKTRFVHWTKKLWFAPNDLKKLAVLGRVTGLYVPFHTYDSMTISFYTGKRGIYYYVTRRDSKGRTTRVRRTRWYPVSGRIDHFFDDVLVCASRGLPDAQVAKLEPWDLHSLQSFDPKYLGGFRTERYQVALDQGFDRARMIMDRAIQDLVRRHIGGDTQIIHSINTQHTGVTFKHILLPVWVATYRYNRKVFQVLVNARTGEVQGERPYSWIKITLAVIAGLIVLAFLIYLLGPHIDALFI